jgi:hypothetical protein
MPQKQPPAKTNRLGLGGGVDFGVLAAINPVARAMAAALRSTFSSMLRFVLRWTGRGGLRGTFTGVARRQHFDDFIFDVALAHDPERHCQ